MRSDRAVKAGVLIVGLVVMSFTGVGCGGAGDGVAPQSDGVPVHVGTVARATLHRFVEGYGRVEPAPPGSGVPPARAIIGAPAGGLLTGIECVQGERVRQGTTLFVLDSRAAEVTAATARTALEYAEKTLQRQRELLEAGGTSERALEEAEKQRDSAANELAAAETQLELLRITAPVSGTVVRIDAALGQPVEPNTILAEIIDLERLVVAAGVPSNEAPNIEPGQRVELAADGSTLGRVVFLGRDVDPATDTVVIRASIPTSSNLRPGQFLEIRVVTDEHRDCLVVPAVSVVSDADQGSWIMVVTGDTAARTPVTTGLREGGLVEVRGAGIEEGTVIVTDDAYGLPAETGIRIVKS